MYLLINDDNSLNFAGEHPIDHRLCLEGVTLVEKHDDSVADVMGGVPIAIAAWDAEQERVIPDPRLFPLNPENNEVNT